MYRNTRAAFEQVDTNLIYAARTLGMSEWKIFWKVVIPSAGPGVLSGTVLAFARALGEYGATSMLAGNIPGKTGYRFPENRNGDSGRGIIKRRVLVCCRTARRIPYDDSDEPSG